MSYSAASLFFERKVSAIESIYVNYKCVSCRKETILLSEEASSTLKSGKYISCPHCGSKKISKVKSADDLRELMAARSYKRVRGAIRER